MPKSSSWWGADSILSPTFLMTTFRIRHSEAKCRLLWPRRLCFFVCVGLSVCLCLTASQHYRTDTDAALGNSRGCRLVVQCWADLQSVPGFRCYDNIYVRIQCYRPTVQCKRVSIDVNAICTTVSQVYTVVTFNKNVHRTRNAIASVCTHSANCST